MEFKLKHRNEKSVEDEIMHWLEFQLGVFACKIQTQAQYDPKRGIYRKLNKWVRAGTADILICVAGMYVALEVKSETGKQSAEQKKFQREVEQCRGHYFVVRSLDEVRQALEFVRKQKKTLEESSLQG